MNPALSVIFFTTLSGAGYGLLAWTAIAALCGQPARGILVSIASSLALVTAGLVSSLFHLGQPQRAWRALSQWRTSWLSREGVAALITYLPAVLLALAALPGMLAPNRAGAPLALSPIGWLLCSTLIACSLATVACTAMIYASLKPIPAWRHRLVLPVYLLFALFGGGLLMLALLQLLGDGAPKWGIAPMVVAGTALLVCKWRYWRDIDATPLPQTRGDAVGLPARSVSVFERPHTEANYLTREMAFVLARTHATGLRWLAVVLFALLPVGCLLVAAWFDGGATWLVVAALSGLAGAFVERWLFFAQARHLVMLYY